MLKFLSVLVHARLHSAFTTWMNNTIGYGGYKLKKKYLMATIGAKVL